MKYFLAIYVLLKSVFLSVMQRQASPFLANESIPHSEEDLLRVFLVAVCVGKMAVWASCWCDPFLRFSLVL